MKTYWNNLNDRERWMLGIGAVCCLFYLFYSVVYSPLTRAVHEKEQLLVEKHETMVWMQQVRQQYKNKKGPQALTSSKLLTVFARELATTSFKQFPYQLQQTGVSDIQLLFDQVPYNAFMNWLWAINEKYSITIRQLNIDRTDTPGVVKLMIILATK